MLNMQNQTPHIYVFKNSDCKYPSCGSLSRIRRLHLPLIRTKNLRIRFYNSHHRDVSITKSKNKMM